jgi:hypothetical protein
VPRTPQEKIDDAAQVHKFTGVAPTVAVHIPWDKVNDYAALSEHAAGGGVASGAVHATVFRDDDYKRRSGLTPDPRAPQSRGSADEMCRHHGRDRHGPEAVVRGRHQLSARRHHRPSGPGRGPGVAAPPRPARMLLEYSCSSRPSTPPTSRTGAPRCCTAGLGPQAECREGHPRARY